MSEQMHHLDSQVDMQQEPLALPIRADTMFGEIVFDQASVFFFPRGIFGFSELRHMGMSAASSKRIAGTQLLQPLPIGDHMFLTIPIPEDSRAFQEEHKEKLLAAGRVDGADHCQILVMLNLKKEEHEMVGYANFKAPLVLNMSKHIGQQFILGDEQYAFQSEIFRTPRKNA